MKSLTCLTLAFIPGFTFSALTVQAASPTPVALTGFNRDVVIENTAVTQPYNAFAMNFNQGENTTFYQTNLPGKTRGLPLNGFFTNASDGSVFQFQPYTSSNSLVLSGDTGLTSGTLNLTTPATFSRIAIIANSGNGDTTGTASLTLRFNDNSTVVTNYYAPDWFNVNAGPLFSVPLGGFERIDLTTGGTSGAPTNPRFYQTTINIFALMGSNNKPLSSITFGKGSGSVGGQARSTGIFAVSGLPSSAITMPAIVNFSASNIFSTSATIGAQVTSTGDETPLVTLFYGTNNGGSNPSAWSNNVSAGYRAGPFSQNISSLVPGRAYFFTARAVNAAGTAWATPSLSFFTPVPTTATITNLPATSITPFTAALNGQVLASGGDTPTITLFYGTSNGSNNPATWASSVELGPQNGAFSTPVFGLSSNTTYFFTARAVNLSGTSWATPSRSFTTPSTLPGPVAVLTQHNDNSKTGANLNETSLNVGNVNTNTFGLIYTRPVDDEIYAQPLVATNVAIPGQGTRNLVFVATVNNSVYAYDADDRTVVVPYWQTNFNGIFGPTTVVAPRNTDMTGACGGNYRDFSGAMGIVGTPVIDPATRTLYLVVRTKETTAAVTTYIQRLYALDIATGTNRVSPVVISGSFAGQTFDPQRNNQRSALTLANGRIFICWSSHCDWGPYHGWVMSYNPATLAQIAVYCDTPAGSAGGIWMSGQGPAADASGNIYLTTGNGTVGAGGNFADPTNRSMSFLKLNGANLNLMSWFTPYDHAFLNGGDWDLGSGGLLLVPGTTLAVGGGKSSSTVSSRLYVVNRDNMGSLSGSTSADTNIIQSISVTPTGLGVNHIHGSPVWWETVNGSFMYVWGESDRLQQYKYDAFNSIFQIPAVAKGPTPAWVNGMTGGMLSISANGTNAGTGILWGAHQFTGDANQAVRPGIIHAYDAQNVTNELWNSEQYSARDSVGNYAKYVPPTVANGKVYMATFSGRLNVYGLLPASAPLIYKQPQSSTRFVGEAVTISFASGGSNPLSYTWKFNGTDVIPGATTANLTLNNVQFSNAGSYTCTITNSLGVTNTAAAVLTVVTAPTISYVKTVIADHPIAYWRLDETSGSVAHDYVGGHDGQYFDVSLGQPGYNPLDSNPAAGFGSISSIDSHVGNIEGIDFSTFLNNATFTVEAWVNGGPQSGDVGIVSYGYGSGGEQFNLDTGSGGRFRFAVRDAVNVAHNASGNILPNNTWQHLVGVCDEPNGFVRLYVNGINNANAAISGGVQMGTSPISIGSRQANFRTTYNLNWVGTIDEVAIYNYALSPAQILSHYMSGTNPAVTLNISRTDPGVTLTWAPGTLQSATNVAGPYSDVVGAASPYFTVPTGDQKYYRVKLP